MVTLNVEGMMCQGCVKRVTSALDELGVQAQISLENGTVSFEGDDTLTKNVSTAIEDLGFVVKA